MRGLADAKEITIMARLFICSTQFQIISTLCLLNDDKENFSKMDNDVIIESGLPHGEKWADILKQSGYVRHVYLLNKGVNFAPLSLSKRILFTRKLRGKVHVTWNNWFLITFNRHQRYLENEVSNNKDHLNFDSSIYDEFFAGSMTGLGIALTKRFAPLKVKIFIYDEGVGSYVGNVWVKRVVPKAIYLFATDLIDTPYLTKQIVPLSKLKHSRLLEIVEKSLNITQESMPNFVFFDQWLGMPTVHDSLPYDGWKTSAYVDKKINLLKRISACVGEGQLGVRLHPTSCVSEVFDYYASQQLELLRENYGIPFELSVSVAKKRPKVLLTIFSSAVITPLTLGIDQDMKVILLWKLFIKDQAMKEFTKDNSITDFFEKIRSKYPNNVYIPETEKALLEILAATSADD